MEIDQIGCTLHSQSGADDSARRSSKSLAERKGDHGLTDHGGAQPLRTQVDLYQPGLSLSGFKIRFSLFVHDVVVDTQTSIHSQSRGFDTDLFGNEPSGPFVELSPAIAKLALAAESNCPVQKFGIR